MTQTNFAFYSKALSRGRGGGGRYFLIWPLQGCAAGQGMVFVLSVLNLSVIIINRVFHARSSNKIEGVVLNKVLKLTVLS